MSVRVFVSEDTRRMAHNLNDLMERWNLRYSSDEPDRRRVKEVAGFVEAQPEKEERDFEINEATFDHLKGMSREELGKLRVELLQDISGIRDQMQRYESNHTGQNVTVRKWYRDAKYVRDAYNALLQATQSEMGRKHKATAKTFTKIFVDIAEEALPAGLFAEIKRLADARYKAILAEELESERA